MTKFPTRPDNGGSAGRPTSLKVNLFKLKNPGQGKSVKFYDVTIVKEGYQAPAAPARGQKGVVLKNPTSPDDNRRIIKLVATNYPNDVKAVSYDGRSNLYVADKLAFDEKTFQVEMPRHADIKESEVGKFAVTIKFVKEISMAVLVDFIAGKPVEGRAETVQEALNAIDIILGHEPSYKFVNRGRSFFMQAGANSLGGGVDVWPGYFQSLRGLKSGLFLNIDVSATAFHTPKHLMDIACEVWRKRSVEELHNYTANERDVRELERSIKLCKVRMDYRSDYVRVMRVEGVSRKSAAQVTFQNDGVETNVADFFEKNYNFRLKFPNLPCIIAGSKKAHIPLEVCTIQPSQIFKRKINELQTANMIKFTCQKPDIRARKIQDGVAALAPNDSPAFRSLGMEVERDMHTVQARVLEPPGIAYNRKVMVPQGGQWNLRDLVFQNGANISCWGVLVIADQRDAPLQGVQRFVGELVNMSTRTGLSVEHKQPPIVYANSEGRDLKVKMRELYDQVQRTTNGPLKFVLCMTKGSKDVYTDIKRLTDSEIGIPSQCMLLKHMQKCSPQYIGNILLKINAKLGGINSQLDKQIYLFDRPTIIFGADVTHPVGGGRGTVSAPSIVAVVASMDRFLASYSCVIQTQDGKTESITKLDEAVKSLLIRFYQKSNMKPAAVVFYRDGVSEGQFATVFDHEARSIQQACLSIQPDGSYQPPITFIVVQKRHHVRFFPQNRNDADRSGNAQPGTVIDTDIVHPTEFDFWLQSHSGIQGTSRPAHYHCLLDQNGFTSDSLQDFTYKLCYTYVRCTRSVSVVPPVYYAHLVAFRARFLCLGDMWDSDTASQISGKSSDAKIMEIHARLLKDLPMFFV